MTELLREWETYYVIIGSSAAALTGLQFVVIALMAESEVQGGEETLSAFGTPTIIHFCAVLLIAAICSTPHQSRTSLGICLVLYGLAGVIYVITVAILARRQRDYQPVLEDWMFHVILPLVAYGSVLVAGFVTQLYFVGASALLLLFIGIHNAWDTAVYISQRRRQG